MSKILKSKKVISAVVLLAVALVSAGLGVEIGAATPDAITGVICQVVECTP